MRPDARWQRAVLLFEQRRWDMAIAELHDLLADEPGHVFANGLLARAFVEKGDLAAALQQAKHTVALAPDRAYVHDNLAEVWIRRSDFAAAVASAQRALELDPEDADIHVTIARARFAQRNWRAALRSAEAGLGLDPENLHCLNLRTLSLVNLGKAQEAHRAASVALAKAPDDAYAHQARGFVLLDAGDVDRALHHFLQALRVEPSMKGARHGLLDAMRRQNRWFRWMRAIGGWLPAMQRPAQVLFVVVMFHNASPGMEPLWSFLSVPLFLFITCLVCVGSAMPLANVMLLLHPIGRHALARRTADASIVIGAGFIAAITMCAIAWIDGSRCEHHGWAFWATLVLPFLGLLWMRRATKE